MIIVDRISQLPNGAPVPPGTEVKLRREIDGMLLNTQLTDIDGWVAFKANGSPGPVYTEVTIGGETRYRYGRAVAQVGSWYEGEWQTFMNMITPGVIMANSINSLRVVPGTGLQVRVSPGQAIAEGILGSYFTHEEVALVGNGSGSPRYDLIVMRLDSTGDEAGKVNIVVVQGEPSATPVEPALPSLPNTAQLILARVRVQSGVSTILTTDIQDRRVEATFVRDGSLTTPKFANKSVTRSKLADKDITHLQILNSTIINDLLAANAVTSDKIANRTIKNVDMEEGAVGTYELANSSVTSAKLATNSVNNVKIAPGTIVNSNMADGAISTSKVANYAITGVKLATNSVDNVKIANNTIVESNLSSPLLAKINVHGHREATLGVGNWVNFSSTSFTTQRSHSITVPAGTWLVFCIWDGRIGSQSNAYGSYQTKLVLSSYGDISDSLMNWETTTLQGIGAGTICAVPIVGPTTRTVSLQSRRMGGANGKVEGSLRLYAIKVGT